VEWAVTARKKVTHSPLKLTTKRSREGVRIPAKKMGPSPRRVSVSSVDGTPLDLSGMAVERPSVVDGITREAEWMRTTIRSRRNHGHHPPWETSNHPMKERHLCLEVLALHAVLVLDGELPALRLGTRRAWESRLYSNVAIGIQNSKQVLQGECHETGKCPMPTVGVGAHT